MSRFSKAVALLVALQACSTATTGGESPVVHVRTDKSEYAAGETVRLTLTNLTDRGLSYNICLGTSLERRTLAGWHSVEGRPDQLPCLAALFELEARADTTALFQLPSGLGAGTYRYRVDSVYESPSALAPEPQRLSNWFEVSGG